MLPKIILTTGCSYGKFAQSFKHWKRFLPNEECEFDGLELVIDLHADSTGTKYQTLSIIETVEKLITNGVSPADIFVLGEYSELSRKDVLVSNQNLVQLIDNMVFKEILNTGVYKRNSVLFPEIIDFTESDFSKSIVELLQLRKFYSPTFPKLSNYYVVNFENISHEFPNKTISDIIKHQLNNPVGPDFFSIDRGIDFFQNVFTAQEYLKLKGVSYKFCLINNQFSLFNQESGTRDRLKTKVVDTEHYLYQDYLNSTQIWEVNSTIKTLYNMIDWNKWWFYENKDKNIILGGIDEYAIDNYGIKVYGARNTDENLFGQHPDQSVYDDLIKNHIFKNHFLKINKT